MMNSSKALTIANNDLRGATSSGIRVASLPTTTVDNGHMIYSNSIYNIGPGDSLIYSQNSGIALINVNDMTLFNNDISSNKSDGISLADATTSLCVLGSYAGSGGPVTIGLTGKPNTVRDNDRGGINICGTGASSPVTIAYNDVYSNLRSGISFTLSNSIDILNNNILSNGLNDEVDQGNIQDASGIRAKDSILGLVSGNIIRNNTFAGVALYGTPGTIGPNNIIMYDGDSDLGSGGPGGSMENCVITAGGSGVTRGGILVRDLESTELVSIDCSNTISENWNRDIAKTGLGTVTSCGNAIQMGGGFFADASDAVYYFDGDSGQVDLDCGGSIINAAGKPFGIIIVGSASDVTVQNCTIQNAAMDNDSRATVNNNGEIRYIGAGIFISNDATPSITNNYIFSNGWGLLDERIYTEAGSSGIQLRCAEANTSIINNIIASNKNDGLVGRETGGLIGVVNLGNTFRNNGRNGIGIHEDTTRNLEIAYNVIHSNLNGGIGNMSTTTATIANNTIYNHIGVDDYGIGNRGVVTIRNNSMGIQSGLGSDQVKLDNSAIGTDDAYNGMILVMDSGSARPKAVRITDYVGSTKTATVYRDWITAPADSDSYRIMDGASPVIKGNDIYNNYIGVASQEYAHPIVGGSNAGDMNDIHDNVDMGVGNMGYSSAIIQGNSIYNQSATDDGGVFCKDYAHPTVGGLGAGEGNTIFNNAGGVRIRGNAAPYVVGNDIYNNTTWYAGVGIIENSLPLIKNNSIRNNSGMGVGFGDNSQTGIFSGIAQIEGNEIYRNEGVNFNIVCQGHPCLEPPYGLSDGIGGIGGSDMVGATIKIVGNNIFSHTGDTLIYSRSSIGFRYATNSDIIIDGNILPDYQTGEQAILAQEFQGGGMTIKNNQIWQVLQFLNNDYVEVYSNPLLTAKTWTYTWMTSGVVNFEHKTDDVAVVHNNTIDGKNIAYDGIAARSDWSDQIADVLITSNVIFDTTEAGVQLGFYPPIRRVRGSVRNNLIYSAGTDAGITVSDAWELEISGNTVYNQPKRAIRLLVPGGIESSPSLVGSQPHSWVRVTDNLIYSTGAGYAVPPSHTGIAVNFSYSSHQSYGDVTINSNRSWGNDGKGI
jgi:parallel beta-helix repeat protein